MSILRDMIKDIEEGKRPQNSAVQRKNKEYKSPDWTIRADDMITGRKADVSKLPDSDIGVIYARSNPKTSKYVDKRYEDNFLGQTQANYRLGQLQVDKNEASFNYMNNPTEENRKRLQAYNALIKKFSENNAETLNRDDATLPWISSDLAGHLPQSLDTIEKTIIEAPKYVGTGLATGAGAGAAAGAPVLGVGAVPGAITGGITGAGLGLKTAYITGSGKSGQIQMAGAAFDELLQMGLSIEDAAKLAKDEGFVNGLIESGEALLDVVTWGASGKIANGIKSFATKKGKDALLKMGISTVGIEKLLSNKAISAGTKLFLDAGGEAVEEGAQQMVSIANRYRADDMLKDEKVSSGKLGLVRDAAIKMLANNFTDEEKQEIKDNSAAGFRIGLMLGGVHGGTNYVADRATTSYGRNQNINRLNAATRAINEMLGDDTLNPLTKKSTDEEIQRRNEEIQERIKNPLDYIKGSEVSPTASNVELQSNAMSGVLGENGKKAFDANFKEGQNEELYTKGFRRMYNLGQSNIPIKKAAAEIRGNKYIQTLSPDQRMAAYYAGQNDAKLQMETEKNAVKYVEFYSDDAGVVENDAAKKVDTEELKAIDRLARSVGAQVVFEEDIEGFNGYIELGKIHISLNAENKLAVVAAHEVTHRMQQLAPESYRKYRDFVMASVGVEGIENYQSKYNAKDIYLSDNEIMDEIAADFTKNILSDPQSMQKFIDDALNGKVDTTASISENRNILQKLFDSIKEFIKKVSEKFSGRKAEQNQAARDAYGVDLETLKQAKNLLQKALKDSADVVANKNANEYLSEKDARRGNEEKKRYSIKRVDEGLSQEYNDISEFIPRKMITKSNIYKFLSDKESWSEANQLAIRWANKAAVETGAQTVISYHGQWYVVEKFDSADMKYQIVGKISSKNYNAILNEVKKYEQRTKMEDSSGMVVGHGECFGQGSETVGGKSGINSSAIGHGRENRPVYELDKEQHRGERPAERNTGRSDERNGSDRENSSVKNSDRKNSVKMDEDILRKHENLKKAYARMAADFSRLKRENREFHQGKIATVAKKLLKDFNFAYDSDLLAEKMSGLSEDTKQMIAGNMDMETFYGKVNEVAKDVIDAGTKADSLAYTESKAMRDYLRTTKITLSEDARNNLGDEYETIRKSTFGRLRLVKEGGTPIDVVYQELSELYPEYFSTETETNASAQLRQIQSVLDGLQSLKSDAFGGYTDEAAEWLSNLMIDQIYNEIFVSGEAGETTVSVDVKAMRAEMADNLQRVMERERQWREREYNKLQTKFEKKTKNYTESRQKAVKVRQIKLHTERLSKALINPSERFAVPEDLKKPVAEFLSCINLENDRLGERTRETLGDLMNTYRKIAEQEYELGMVLDPQLVYNIEDISEAVKELGVKDKRVSDLDLVTLEKLRTSIMSMETMLRNYNQTFRDGKKQQIDVLAAKACEEIKERVKGIKKNSKIRAVKSFSDMLNFDMLNPWDYFHQMGGTFEELFSGLREGENRQIKNLARGKEYLEEMTEKHGISKKDMMDKSLKTFKLANGETVELTKAQVMSLYLLWRQNQTHEHITEGGIRPAKVTQKLVESKDGESKVKMSVSEDYNAVRANLDDIGAILETLSDNEKKFAESISDFFVDECAEWGNEVALKLFGYKKFNTPNYFPIVSDKMYLQEDFGVSADSTIKNMGITKRRIKHANNPIIIEDIFDVYARHVSDMAKYNAYVLPLQDIQRVFNYVSRGEFGGTTERVSITEQQSEKNRLIDLLVDKQKELLDKGEIFRVTSDKLIKGKNASTTISNYFDSIGNKAVNPELGEVELSKRGAKSTVFHGVSQGKMTGILTVKDVIEKGKIIDIQRNWKGRGYDTYTLAGQGVIDGESSVVGVIVKNYPKGRMGNKFYLHEVIKIEDTINDADFNSLTRVTDTAVDMKTEYIEVSSENNISQKSSTVNTLKEGEGLKALIATKFGKQAVDYFSKLMVDINMGINNQYGNALSSNLISKYKQAKMGLNARVVVQQPVSYIRAAALIDSKYMTKAMGKKVDIETVFKYSPIAQWKSWGFFSTDTGKDMYSLMTGEKDLADYTMALAGKADEMTWKRIWAAVELETADLHPDLQKGSEAFYEACGKRFDEIIDRTQVVDSTLHRSQALRSPDGFTKMAYSFMSEPLKTYNLLRSAAVDAVSTKDAESKKALIRTVGVCAISSIVLACVTGAFDTLTGDDEEEFLENFKDNLKSDALGMLPYVKDIYSVVQGFTVERMDMQGLSDAANAVLMIPKEQYTWSYKVANLSAKFAELLGVPVGSFKKSVYDLVLKNVFKGTDNFLVPYTVAKQMYYVDGKKQGEFLNILFDAYSAGNKKHYNKIFKDMMKEGVDAKTIEKGLRSRFKKSGIKETFAVPWTKPYTITTEEDEDKFGLKDLSASQYQTYQSKVTALEKDIVGDLKRMRSGLSEVEYQKRLKAAYEYSTETALEKVAREKYESEKSWVNKAQIAEEKYGLEPAEFIMFYKYYNELTPPAGQEKFKTGQKKNLIIDYLNGMELTDEEWRYLYQEVAGYKK